MNGLRRWLRRDRGSMAVEFVVAAPLLVFLLVLVSAGGQWLSMTGDVGSAARDAVRAASLGRTLADAQTDAQQAAQADLNGKCGSGPGVSVKVFSGGVSVGAAGFAAAQNIQVTVTCTTSLEAFDLLRFPVSQTFGDAAVAPLDPFEDRGN